MQKIIHLLQKPKKQEGRIGDGKSLLRGDNRTAKKGKNEQEDVGFERTGERRKHTPPRAIGGYRTVLKEKGKKGLSANSCAERGGAAIFPLCGAASLPL